MAKRCKWFLKTRGKKEMEQPRKPIEGLEEREHFNAVDSNVFRDEKDVKEFSQMLKKSKDDRTSKTD